MDGIHDDDRAFHRGHCSRLPPPTWDIRILMMTWRASERYVRIGFGLLYAATPAKRHRRREAHQLHT